ncbi:hypothetical protein CJJ07_002057 [Candidozyma auris]|nr:hypothetical protein CJJ07_002057 [[Candida] auris]QEL58165.1 hypothetical protein CJJ09_000198 [[Candida] auris]
MGSSASRPARKLTKNIVNTDKISRSSKAQLPPQSLRDKFEKSGEQAPQAEAQAKEQQQQQQQTPNNNLAHQSNRFQQSAQQNGPPGKDGMDPTADQAFIDSISKLGRQIRSEAAQTPGHQQLNVRALKQLRNRKALYEKGQKEVEDQLDSQQPHSRTMIHPKTLTAILNAYHDETVTDETLQKDYELSADFLQNLKRFKVAQNIVPLQEDTKEDEVGPRTEKDRVRVAETDEGAAEGDFEAERLKQLRKRLE